MTNGIFAGLSLAASLLATSAFSAPGRLPGGVVPVSYDITVEPNAARLTFAGRSTIVVQVTQPTKTITLNAADIAFGSASVDGAVATVSTDAEAQTATLTLARPVAAGRHSLAFVYTGKIAQAASGLFAIDYDGAKGAKERMIVSQFEPADGRRVAPMWDEPGFKTPFTIGIVAPSGMTAFSNMPLAAKTPKPGGKQLWRFKPTPKMSSYLMFFGMGNVDRKTVMAGKTEIGVITRKGVGDQGDYALASAQRVLAAYNDYFGTPYPLPKLDMIAGPGNSQFFSAMENWGAIFYFERILLIDPKLATENQKQDIFNVVAHEMAHQWFGDLVTMSWWDDLWLNEGYASWMASKISNDLNPEWNALSQTLADDRQSAMSRDARSTTHPIVQHVTTPDQINQAFDDITYRKGEAVIRMLEGAVGPKAFRDGVRSYMAKYKFGNTVTDQLWAEIGGAAQQDVTPLMHSFTLQGGVPMILVGAPACANGATTMTLAQSRFGLDQPSKAAQTWTVPVSVGAAFGSGAQRITVSGAAPIPVTVSGCGPVVVNKGQSAYFRTLYGDAQFEVLRSGFAKLGLDDQIGLLADSYGLANSNDAAIERYLGLLDTIAQDAPPLVWSLAAGQLSGIDTMLAGAPEQAAFRAKAARMLAPVFARVGWLAKPGEPAGDAQLREELIPVVGRFGDLAAVAEARRYVAQSFATPDAVPGAIRRPAIRSFAYNATPADWDMLHARAKAEPSPIAKQLYYANLGAARDLILAQRALDLAASDEVPPSLRATIIQTVAAVHPELAFDWAVAHKDMVTGLLESSTRASFIVGLPAGSGDVAVVQRVRAFAEANLPPESRKPAETTIAIINYRAGLRQRQAAAIGKWASVK